MPQAQVGVLLALAAVLAVAAAAAANPRRGTPGGASRAEGTLCAPCHCKDDTLDCTVLPTPRDAAWMQAFAGWNTTR